MMQQTYIGVDISKATLDIFSTQQGFGQLDNDAAGVAEVVSRARTLRAWVIFEACGAYERRLARWASAPHRFPSVA